MKIIAIKQYKGGNWTEAIAPVIDHNLVDLNIKNGAGAGSIVSKNMNPEYASGENSIVLQEAQAANGKGSFAGGYYSNANAAYSFVFGTGAGAFDNQTFIATTAEGIGAFAFGKGVVASKEGAWAIGWNSIASGEYSFAFGSPKEANEINERCEASGIRSIAIGRDALATGENAVAIGRSPKSYGHTSFVIGQLCEATETANASFTGGRNNHNAGDTSLVFGEANTHGIAKGTHILGQGIKSGTHNHSFFAGTNHSAEGKGYYNIILGYGNFIDHLVNEVNQNHLIGEGLRSSYSAKTILGRFNIDNNNVFEIGIGKSDSNRYNFLEVDFDKNAKIICSNFFINSNKLKLNEKIFKVNANEFSFGGNEIKFNEDKDGNPVLPCQVVVGNCNTGFENSIFEVGTGNNATTQRNTTFSVWKDTEWSVNGENNQRHQGIRIGGSADTNKASYYRNDGVVLTEEMLKYMSYQYKGAIYISLDPTSPATIFGGTWERIEGQFLLGAGKVEDIEFKAGENGGLKDAVLVEHIHKVFGGIVFNSGDSGTTDLASTGYGFVQPSSDGQGKCLPWENGYTHSNISESDNKPENTNILSDGLNANMPPYLTVYMWQRIA